MLISTPHPSEHQQSWTGLLPSGPGPFFQVKTGGQILQFAHLSPLTPEDEASSFSSGSMPAVCAAPLASAPAKGGFWLQGTPNPPAYSMPLAKNKIDEINKFMAFSKAKTDI